MTRLLTLVVAMTVLTWLAIIVASTLRSKGDMKLAMSNRDNLPEPTPLAARADRAAKNTMENFILFAALALAAAIAAPNNERVLLGAQIFFWARVVYLPIYYAGIQGVRTGVWALGVAGMALMVAGLLTGP
ncbi:MAPEG family protein [Rhizobacter sp. J219]|uniref:MAPEG family protein n=1 Tax=Rhizobacter sp. J219 TaxID=2898430 RepID=UPI0021519384|nr:MAPEG family protein [Rhizobacter sp. J219]MCR5885790.1 MAPEG family protein [Rhizobacter sp. J219]